MSELIWNDQGLLTMGINNWQNQVIGNLLQILQLENGLDQTCELVQFNLSAAIAAI